MQKQFNLNYFQIFFVFFFIDLKVISFIACNFFNMFQLSYTEDGLEAIVFTAQGDMRQALNNLQSTANGFDTINGENVFKVCDEPHPLLIKDMLHLCVSGDVHKSCKVNIVSSNIKYFLELFPLIK